MTSALTSPFFGLPIDEAIPLAAEIQGVSRSSILQGRRRVRFQAQTGLTATPGAIVQFVLSDSTGLLDVNSMTLSCTLQVLNKSHASNPAVFDEGPSFIRRGQVVLNGSLLEDIDSLHRASNLRVLSTCGQDFYEGEGSFMNYWKFNSGLGYGQDVSGVGQVPYHRNDVLGKLNYWANQQVAVDGLGVGIDGGIQVMYPMGLLFPALASNKYYPLRSMGEMVISLTMANAAEALFCPGTAAGDLTYVVKDIFLECDIVVPLPEYAQLLDRVCMMENEPGLVLPVDTVLVSQGQNIPGAANATENAVIVSRATTNLRSVIFAAQPTGGINNFKYPSVSCFPDEGFVSYQLRVGSLNSIHLYVGACSA
jgi:hypothetical protein